jgi:hypothetical protein
VCHTRDAHSLGPAFVNSKRWANCVARCSVPAQQNDERRGTDVKLTRFVRPAPKNRPATNNARCRLIKLDFTRVGGCCRGAVGTFRPRAECVIYLRLLPGLKRFISFCARTAPKIQTVENLLPLQKTQPGMCSA